MHKHITATVGPMGATTSDLVLGMKALLPADIHLIDPNCAPCPWRNQEFLDVQNDRSKTKIGILAESPLFPVSASVKRAI